MYLLKMVIFGQKKQQWIVTILRLFFLMPAIFSEIPEEALDAKFPFP